MPVSIDKFPLEKRLILKKTIAKSMKWYILLGIFLLLDLYGKLPPKFPPKNAYLITAILILILELIYQIMHFKRYYYDLQNKYITIREGVLSRRERTLPYHRVHDIYVDQDWLDRILRIWDLHLTTATSQFRNVHIEGFSGKTAKIVRDVILEKI